MTDLESNKDNKVPSQSALSRFLEIGGLATSIGFDIVSTKTGNLFQNTLQKEKNELNTWVSSALKMVTTLGNLKGAAMKVGQMLSLYESFLPPEVIQVLSTLQKQAPPVQIQKMMSVLEEDIPNYKLFIKEISTEALASASIGQVHRAELQDGRQIVLKMQYPGMEKVIKSDIGNLRILLRMIAASLPFKADVNAMFAEVKEMIIAELDYEAEAQNQEKFRKLFLHNNKIVIPEVVPELCGKRVLATIYEPGLDLQQVSRSNQSLRNDIGNNIFQFYLQQLFNFRCLHSDPNAGNFSFREDGSIVVYDFGSVKVIPEKLVQGYRELFFAILKEKSSHKVASVLQSMGIHKSDGSSIKKKIVDDWFVIYEQIFYSEYCFGGSQSQRLTQNMKDMGQKHFFESMDMVFPADIIFIDRTFGGLFGNLGKLGACANWGNLIARELEFSKETR